MTSKRLTKQQALLLQRFVDGQADDDQRRAAEDLLESSPPARVYVAALEELGHAVRAAEQEAWRRASPPPVNDWVRLAETSTEFVDASLDELAPLLERFHDGEADRAEAAVVAGLIDERDDVAGYLAELDGLASALRQGLSEEKVDFGGFWDGIAAAIDEEDSKQAAPTVPLHSFDAEEHRLLLYRYHDGEVDQAERAMVEGWIAADNEEVDAILGAMAEIGLGVTAGIEQARESANLDQLWHGLEDHLDAIDAERAADNVVAFDRAPDKDDKKSTWNHPLFAMAAAVVLLITGALVGPQLMQSQEEIVETRTIVIFDNVETAPGSSFHVSAPEFAGHEFDAAEADFFVSDDDPQPTVLWLIEDDEDDDDDDDDIDELPGPI